MIGMFSLCFKTLPAAKANLGRNRMLKLQKSGDSTEDEISIELPSMEVARTFSVETIDYPHPLGVHQVHRWLKEQMLSLDTWCPEYQLCSEEHIKDTT